MFVVEVTSYPHGAPLESCATLSPDPVQHGADPQEMATPYVLNFTKALEVSGVSGYVPGQTYKYELV